MLCKKGALRNATIHRKISVQESGLKKRIWRRCFHVNFVKFLRTPFLQNTSVVAYGDDSLYLICEDGKEHNRYAVVVMIGGPNGRHVQKKLRIFNLFFALPNFTIKCNVTGKQINLGAGYGLKIPSH